MHSRPFFLTTLTAIIVLTAGCGVPMQVSPPEQVNLTAADNGGNVPLFIDQELVIRLDGNPSTGYTWEAKDMDASMFNQIGEAQFSSSNSNLVGSGGTLTMTFRVLKPGKASLTLIYHRPWEKDVQPLNTFSVQVTVK